MGGLGDVLVDVVEIEGAVVHAAECGGRLEDWGKVVYVAGIHYQSFVRLWADATDVHGLVAATVVVFFHESGAVGFYVAGEVVSGVEDELGGLGYFSLARLGVDLEFWDSHSDQRASLLEVVYGGEPPLLHAHDVSWMYGHYPLAAVTSLNTTSSAHDPYWLTLARLGNVLGMDGAVVPKQSSHGHLAC